MVQQNTKQGEKQSRPRQNHQQKPAEQPPRASHSEQKNHAAEIKRLPPAPPPQKPPQKKAKGIMGLIEGIVPGALYNRENKKIFGILSAEDLLLIALIFIFADSGEEDGNLICLALLYVLLSDYIDLSDYF